MNADYRDAIADHGSSLITHVSLADGPDEGDELAVDRQAVTWTSADDGDIEITAAVQFNVPGGSTVNHVQYWSSLTGGTYYGSSTVTEEGFGGAGVYELESAEIQHNAGVV